MKRLIVALVLALLAALPAVTHADGGEAAGGSTHHRASLDESGLLEILETLPEGWDIDPAKVSLDTCPLAQFDDACYRFS